MKIERTLAYGPTVWDKNCNAWVKQAISEYEVEIEIDVEKLVRLLGYRAIANNTKKALLAEGIMRATAKRKDKAEA